MQAPEGSRAKLCSHVHGLFFPHAHPSEKLRACGSLFPSRLMEPDGAGLFTGHTISQECHDNRSQTWWKRQDLDPHKLEACKDGLLFKGKAKRGQGYPSQMPCAIYLIGKSGKRGIFLTRAGKICSEKKVLGTCWQGLKPLFCAVFLVLSHLEKVFGPPIHQRLLCLGVLPALLLPWQCDSLLSSAASPGQARGPCAPYKASLPLHFGIRTSKRSCSHDIF